MLKYTGIISKVRFYSEDSHYIVAVIDVEEELDSIVMNGYMANFNDYDKYIFYGDYEVHPKYGKQFKLDHYEIMLSNDRDNIIKYLSSPLFKGVGKKLAENIFDALGEQCLIKIKEDKHCLDYVKAMTETKREEIYHVLMTNDFDQEVMQFFMGHGISLKNLGLIQATYQEKTLQVLQNNPYQLIEDIDGIGFNTADELALKIGVDPGDLNRIKAAIIYSVKQLGFQTGSTYQDIDEIIQLFNRTIYGVSQEIFESCLEELEDEGLLIVKDNRYYYYQLYEAESEIGAYIKGINSRNTFDYDEQEVERLLNNYQTELGICYADKQKEAIHAFLKNPFMILTGGPGTGKTTIVKGLLQVYQTMYPDDRITLIAPTGRAAKRLNELTGLHSCTIHRELKWDLHSNKFAMNHNNPLDSDILIVDEFSMVDTILLSKLFDACIHIKKILFIGDYHQLPSVGPGNILKDLMKLDLHIIELNEIFRQNDDSGIVHLAHQIINNELDSFDVFDQYRDINFFNSTNIDMNKNVKLIVQKAIDEGYNINDIQVLAPMYQGVAGIDALNETLQEVFNPKSIDKKEFTIGRKRYRIGDKILQLKNRVDDDVFNGDIGILVDICKKDNFEYLEDTLIVDFDGNFVEYTPKVFNTITHAYCMSIHKSQGSEFKIVIMTVLNDYYIMLRRNLLYTGITRAKQSLFILGNPDAFVRGINNCNDNRRKTSLIEFFKDDQEINLYDFMD